MIPDEITIPIGTSIRDAERLLIEATLRDVRGNVSLAARILEIDRTTLYKKIKAYRNAVVITL